MVHLRVIGNGESESFGSFDDRRVQLFVFLTIVLVIAARTQIANRIDTTTTATVRGRQRRLHQWLLYAAVRRRVEQRASRQLVHCCQRCSITQMMVLMMLMMMVIVMAAVCAGTIWIRIVYGC